MVTDCPDEQEEILRNGRILGAALRSNAIREFCERAGISASVEAQHISDDVRAYRMQVAVRSHPSQNVNDDKEGGE